MEIGRVILDTSLRDVLIFTALEEGLLLVDKQKYNPNAIQGNIRLHQRTYPDWLKKQLFEQVVLSPKLVIENPITWK